MDFYGFYTGKIFDAYKYLGAHTEKQGVTFRTFAPSASRITLIGEFNEWQEWDMNKVSDGNFWECYVPQAKAGRCISTAFMTEAEMPWITAIHMVSVWNSVQTVLPSSAI